MKVLLITCNIKLEYHRSGKSRLRWESTYREGLASIAASLENAGIEVGLFKVESGLSEKSFIEFINEYFFDYTIAGFTMNTVDVAEVSRLVGILKKHFPKIFTIAGGMHPTLAPEESIALPGLDAICRGEGEYALLELCEYLNAGKNPVKIEGLWIKKNNTIIKNPIRPLIEYLDSLPKPLRTIFTITSYPIDSVKDLPFFVASRGCPYKCTYCCNDSLRSVLPKNTKYYRIKSVDRVIEEIKDYTTRYPKTGFIYFYDDVLMFYKKWFKAFAEQYHKEINIRCFLTARWELLSEQSILLLKAMRCFLLLIGVEVGSEELRYKILKRYQKDEMMLQKAVLLQKHRIRYGLYTMVGLPTETMADALETVKLSVKLKGHILFQHHSIFFPFPSTPLNAYCIDQGLISDRKFDSYFEDTKLDMPQFPSNQVVWAHRRFTIFRCAYWFFSKWPEWLSRFFSKRLDRIWLRKAQK